MIQTSRRFRLRSSRSSLPPSGRATRHADILTGGEELARGKAYAERAEPSPGWHDRLAEQLFDRTLRPLRSLARLPDRSLRAILPQVHCHGPALQALTDAELATTARAMRARLRRDGFTVAVVGECFALISEASARTLGRRHYDSQLLAGWGLLQGKLVEMATGEGKSFAATLPASTVALAGYPVHVITVNDYLAERDAEEMAPLYRFLGLTVGAVGQDTKRQDRPQIYRRSIVYCTNKDVAFDYLRDGVALAGRSSRLHLAIDRMRGNPHRPSGLTLRGLYFAIVDEADSVFIDEARTPLILSVPVGPSEEAAQCEQALAIAAALVPHDDYELDLADRVISLTDDGRDRIETLTEGFGGVWTSVRGREELVAQALTALHLFRRDQHYVVTDGKVRIVDESTGRVMPDRSWDRGLHQMIETKEGCDLTELRDTLARLTYQRLFRRYVRLSGMSGTGIEVAPEIRTVYGLDVVRIPLHRPSRRHQLPPLICATTEEKWRLVVASVARLAVGEGRPVLIGTRSVGASEEISAVLTEHGIAHALLNARQDAEEAEIIGQAGLPGRVTVATNMAGRGTDIRLEPEVRARGGLHVILTEFHDSRRIDRQLFGRCARQGDPGSCQAIVSLHDEVYTTYAPRATRLVAALVARGVLPPGMVSRMVYGGLKFLAQRSAEQRGADARVRNMKADRQQDVVLAFSGRRE